MSSQTPLNPDPTTMDALTDDLDRIALFVESDAPTRLHNAAQDLKPLETGAQSAQAGITSSPTHGSNSSSPCFSSCSAASKSAKSSSPRFSANAPSFVPSPTKPCPMAPEFSPSPTKLEYPSLPTVNSMLEVCDIPGKGKGVIATRDILAGTRILREAPILRLDSHTISLTWAQYQALDKPQKDVYDSLCSLDNQELPLANESRMLLLPTAQGISENEFDALVAECTRVLSIFKANAFEIDGGSAVFALASRFNHSCVPNVHHTFNSELQEETLHATRFIEAGEELSTNYMGHLAYYQVHTQRWEWLRQNYDFTCQCAACIDITGFDDTRRELLYAITWGLHQFRDGYTKNDVPVGAKQYVPEHPTAAYDQVTDIVEIMKRLEVHGPEEALAHRTASELKFELGDFQEALQHAVYEMSLERDMYGSENVCPGRKSSDDWIREIRTAAAAQPADAGPKKKNRSYNKPFHNKWTNAKSNNTNQDTANLNKTKPIDADQDNAYHGHVFQDRINQDNANQDKGKQNNGQRKKKSKSKKAYKQSKEEQKLKKEGQKYEKDEQKLKEGGQNEENEQKLENEGPKVEKDANHVEAGQSTT